MRGDATRRRFLTGAAGALVAGTLPALAGAQEGDSTPTADGPGFDGWLEGVDGGFEDATGRDRVTVEVGAEGNGGQFAFSPAGLAISPGTTVVWKWVSDSHYLAVDSQPDGANWSAPDSITRKGETHEHTFEVEGTYRYHCEPHRALGAKGAILVGDPGTPVPTPEDAVSGPELPWLDGTPNYDGRIADRRGQSSATVDVGVSTKWDRPVPSPAAVWVDPGTEVRFRWRRDDVGLSVDFHPEGSDWTGHPSAEPTGFSHSHTFDARGVHVYEAGSTGAVLVGDAPTEPDDPTGGAAVEWSTVARQDQRDLWTWDDEAFYWETGGSGTYTVVATDRESGERRWRASVDGESVRPATAHGGRAHLIADADLVALGDGGERAWTHSLTDAADLGGAVRVTAGDDRLLVAVSNRLEAVDADEGRREWRVTVDGASRLAVGGDHGGGSPPSSDGTLFVTGRAAGDAADEEVLAAVDADAGSVRWTTRLPGADHAVDAVRDEAIVVSGDAAIRSVRRESGSTRWTYRPSFPVRFVVPDDERDRVYVHTSQHEEDGGSALHAVDAASGERAWRIRLPDVIDPEALFVADAVYAGTVEGLFALDPATGETAWHDETGVVFSAVRATEDALCVAVDDHQVRVVERDSGTLRWSFDTGRTVQHLHLADDELVALNRDDLLAFALDDGRLRWSVEAPPDAGLWWFDAGSNRHYVGSSSAIYAVSPGGGGLLSALPGEVAGVPLAGLGAGVAATLLAAGGVAWYRSGGDRSAETGAVGGSPAAADEASGGGEDAGDGPTLAADVDDAESALETLDPAPAGPTDADAPPESAPTDGTADGPASEGTADASAGDGMADASAGDGTADASAGDGTADAHASAGMADAPAAGEPTPGPPDEVPGAPSLSLDHGEFADEAVIGQGGNADVHRASVTRDGEEHVVAVKRPRVAGTMHAEAADRFVREAETWSNLDDHDHVVDVVDYGDAPVPWIAMEYMDGGSLAERVGEMPLDQALWTAVAVARAVRHAHRHGVVHLDLTPGNVLFLSVEGAWDAPKVADWGLAKHLLEHSQSVEGFSPHYAAPEQFDDEFGPTDHLTDVYQLGAVCYELLTGERVFEGSTSRVVSKVLHEDPVPPTERDPDLPDRLDEVLGTALATDRADRYEDVLLFRDDLQAIYGSASE